ncbi:Re/Si-specific NAD(P)(+) transhydrogenase subunit alpha [Devriesea agamarum]|uniref:Re/Si-specific NAD(P)(+) transhydrogenase subunit alpha n=1 Tax=Devriesea agamarum TaxID=472569 RepID=UPI00071C53E6|nr:Re/Si-specific NAD(P)(+) transhydrogenase subunit alpha [Devriesea agamarum]
MRIGIPHESAPGERRVAATPTTVKKLASLGYEVLIEAGAGVLASHPDSAYAEAGAQIVTREEAWGADIVLAVGPLDVKDVPLLRSGAVLAAFLYPAQNPELVDALAERGVCALAMDMVPRISRAQSMDALSSMANISGYRAVVEAAGAFGRFFTGQVTAAGKVPPARVFVLGAGVAGLAAIGAAGSLGAVVRASDVRPETAEQVTSMGAEFVTASGGMRPASSDGYAREPGAEDAAKAAELYAEQCAWADIVITTAAVPGRPSPRLITDEMVAAMRPGSVIVDLAAAGGGNCTLTRRGEAYVSDNGVVIIGYDDMPSRLPGQSSQLYGTNLVNLLTLMTPEKDGQLVVDTEDVIVRTMLVTRDGEVTFPPPPVAVSAAPAPAVAPAAAPTEEAPPKPPRPWWVTYLAVTIPCLVFLGISPLLPGAFLIHLSVFVLAVIVGYYVVWKVSHALHTPLMSVTNAISGIIVVGAIYQITSDNWLVKIIAFFAVLIASINIVGGFAVTQRMLRMFRKA